jgi:hypothetical protein
MRNRSKGLCRLAQHIYKVCESVTEGGLGEVKMEMGMEMKTRENLGWMKNLHIFMASI